MADKPRVQFVCVRNAGRSQMAAALLSRLAGDRALHPRRPSPTASGR
jgi:protein-tyrosine-phosphatase